MGVLWDCLAKRLAEYPEQSINENGCDLSYTELLQQVGLLSGKLIRQRKYGILCSCEISKAIAILACFAAGAVAVPMHDRYGKQHSQKIIDNIRLSWLIVDTEIQKIREEIPEDDNLSNTAIIMCTSGTTGMPKGVKLSDGNLLCNMKAIQSYFKLSSSDRICILRPLFHISALTGEFLVALYAGAEIYFTGNNTSLAVIANAISQDQITVFCTTPTAMPYYCHYLQRVNPHLLRKIVVSGECLIQPVVEIMFSTFPNVEFFNGYGLTEASPRVAALLPEEFVKYPTSVGKPIKGVDIKIINGELWVHGPNVMQGYYANPTATAEKLVNNWLHTGDMAQINEHGFLYIKGRIDEMIIRAGVNVYPQEIESALQTSPLVQEALAFERDGRIVVKIVGEISKKETLALCQRELPPYALPDQIEFVKELPKNAVGKLVRH